MDVREILHWLVTHVTEPAYTREGGPTPADIHQHIDVAYGYVPPKVTEVDKAVAALAAAQARLDAAKAEEAAGVEHTPSDSG